MITSIKLKLRGAVEIMLFMPGAEKAFRGTNFQSMLRSFLIPLCLIPYGIWGITLTHGTELSELSKLDGLNDIPLLTFIVITIAKAILITILLITAMYYFAKLMERTEYFYDYISAGNWIIIPGMVPSLVITGVILTQGQDWMGIYMLATLNILYGLAVSTFLITRTLNIPWELAGACAIFDLGINETANKAVNLIGINYFA